MRIIGFIGILLLAIINAVGFVISLQDGSWKGVGLMLFMAALLVFFAHTLRRGANLERRQIPGERLALGWGGESVFSFARNQVARSLEGRILIIGSMACLAMTIISAFTPGIIALEGGRGSRAATLFAVWPVLAFVLYVRICGPRFETSVLTILSMLVVVVAPFVLAYA